jgi:hypothetical protein
MIVTAPIRIESTPNLREHWAARAKRSREQRTAIWYALKAAKVPYSFPCRITITRIAPRALDTDNLAAGCKAVRDGIADWLELLDNHPSLTWAYAQETGKPKEYALKVEIA